MGTCKGEMPHAQMKCYMHVCAPGQWNPADHMSPMGPYNYLAISSMHCQMMLFFISIFISFNAIGFSVTPVSRRELSFKQNTTSTEVRQKEPTNHCNTHGVPDGMSR